MNDNQWRAYIDLARSSYRSGDIETARRQLDEAVQIARGGDSTSLAALLIRIARESMVANDHEKANELLNAIISICAELGVNVHPHLHEEAESMLGFVLKAHLKKSDHAVVLWHGVRDSLKRLQGTSSQSSQSQGLLSGVLENLALDARAQAKWDLAVQYFRESVDASPELSRIGLPVNCHAFGEALWKCGKLVEAESVLKEAIGSCTDVRIRNNCRRVLVDVYNESGRHQDARVLAHEIE